MFDDDAVGVVLHVPGHDAAMRLRPQRNGATLRTGKILPHAVRQAIVHHIADERGIVKQP